MRIKKLSFYTVRFSKRIFLFPLMLLVFVGASAQHEKVPLRDVLQTVEHQYAVSFTYSDENVAGVVTNRPPGNISLSEVLTFLNRETGLLFTPLDQRFITVSKLSAKQVMPVCGTILDEETNEKIVGATVQANGIFSISDMHGYFELQDLEENSIVTIKSLGYEPLSVDARSLLERPCASVRLTLASSLLPEVMIRHYMTTGIRKKLDGSLSIQSIDLGILPGLTEPDVLITLQALPGIQSIDETVSNINVRGGTHDQNLVLWDGMRMYQQGHFFGLISAFSPYLTHDVSLIKNGTSVLYGEGVSSTIDIRSDDEVAHTLTGSAGINMLNVDVLAKIPLTPKTSVQLSARRSIADVVETPTYRSYYDRAFGNTDVTENSRDSVEADEDFNFYDFSTKFLYDISSKDKLRISFLTIHNRIAYAETDTLNLVAESNVSSLEQQNMAAGISYSRLWSSAFKTSGQWYLSWYNLNAVNVDLLQDQRLVQENEVIDMGIKLDAQVRLSSQLDLFSGYQLFEVGVSNLEDINNPPFYRLKKTVLRTHVLLAEMNYTSPSANTTIRAGLRGNYFSEFKTARLEPRFSINQKISTPLSLELLGEMKSQTLTQIIDFQNDFLGIEKRKWVMANEADIPIITSQQISAGIHYHQQNLLVSLEGYGKWVDNIITSSQGFQNQFQYVRSSGSYTAAGIDFLINRRISNFNTWFSYSFSKNTYSFPELVPPHFPSNLDIRHRATGGISYHSTHLDISCGVHWHTGKPYTNPVTSTSVVDGEIIYQSPNAVNLDNYWRVDFSARYTFQLATGVRGNFGLSLWNLLNHENVVDAYYNLGPADELIFSQRKALGFTPNVMVRVEF